MLGVQRCKVVVATILLVLSSCSNAEGKQSPWVDEFGHDWRTEQAYAKGLCIERVWSKLSKGSERPIDAIVSEHPKGGLMVIITSRYEEGERSLGDAYCWFRDGKMIEHEITRY